MPELMIQEILGPDDVPHGIVVMGKWAFSGITSGRKIAEVDAILREMFPECPGIRWNSMGFHSEWEINGESVSGMGVYL